MKGKDIFLTSVPVCSLPNLRGVTALHWCPAAKSWFQQPSDCVHQEESNP